MADFDMGLMMRLKHVSSQRYAHIPLQRSNVSIDKSMASRT